ncbi:hypothetical protein ACAG23_20115 [Escherichia coli]
MACQAERGGRRPEALVAAARRGETRSGSMRSTAERPRRGNARCGLLAWHNGNGNGNGRT